MRRTISFSLKSPSYLELLLLVVGPVVEAERGQPEDEDDAAGRAGHEAGPGHEVVGGEGVEHLDPGEAAPAQVVARPVQRNVQRVEVPRLPVEELQQVQVDQDGVSEGSEVEPVPLDGGDGEVEDEERPAQHPEPAVGQLLDVHPEQAGVQLDPGVELVGQRRRLQTLIYLGEMVS